MRNSTQAHLRFLTLAAVHKVLKDRTEVLVPEGPVDFR